jgi:DNA-binding protein H-NS
MPTEASISEKPTVAERIKQLDAERARLMADAKADALSRAQQAVSELNALGLPYVLGEGSARAKPKRTRRPLSPKYINPADPAQTWTGRGRMPAWVRELIDSGSANENSFNPERP